MHTPLHYLNDIIAAAPAPGGGGGGPKTLPEVIEGVRLWIMGIIAAVATMFLVVGGLRYMAAGGDPSQVEQAKGNFKSALIGYALAVLAPVLLTVLQGIIGG
ncbi:pilin [Catellatospora bangladeshensis]|uniref:Uncharacterized protein n=1 Tax=Catellatospora bangladeshensis TaxID=310355 RepID=A0A8J3JLI0_9ACTN|nr:pilin [Catellatospora bangladeshensis]GIF80898.1 hypothetical protein Cba03nite_22470 [Catellatospora bangladeshensis]